MMNKKGLSAVIATVLLVLVSFVAIGIIIEVIIPMVRENLVGGKSCFELREYFKITESSFTCYSTNNTKLMVSRGMENFDIKGFAVSIVSESESKRYDVVPGAVAGVGMWNKTGFVDYIEIPQPGEARSYIFDAGNGRGASISALQKNSKVCDAESYDIPAC